MIIKQHNSYLGLDQLITAVTDTSPKSADYLRIDSLPVQLTAGRNAIKLFGNPNVFAPNSPILVEVLDNRGYTIYQFMPDYYDSMKRRSIVIQVDENTAPGPALITICSVLRNELVSPEWRNTINFKWQIQLNVAPFASNDTEIIYTEPPIVEFNTRVKPFVTASRRNDLEMITYQYGDYKFYDYNFEDHIGDADGSDAIFQSNKADTLLGSYVDPSITAFDRDNVFYLREENFSAKHVVKNYSILYPGDSYYTTLGTDLVYNGILSGSLSDIDGWTVTGGVVSISNNTFEYYGIFSANSDYIAQNLDQLEAGAFYLFQMVDPDLSNTTVRVELGYDINRNSGSISDQVTKDISYTKNTSEGNWYTGILRASDAGRYLYISFTDAIGALSATNIRLYKITPVQAKDFTLNSDLIGGFVKIKTPSVEPKIPAGYVIEDDEPKYESYIDVVFQEHDAGTDDRFYYDIVSQQDKDTPYEAYNLKKYKIDRFDSLPTVDSQNILSNIQYRYEIDSNVNLFPIVTNCLNPVLFNNKFYGTFADGGRIPPHGTIFEYDPATKKFKVLFNFDGVKGSSPNGKLLPTKDSVTGLVTFYGTTVAGGKFNSGSLYSYTPSNNTFRLLYEFGLGPE